MAFLQEVNSTKAVALSSPPSSILSFKQDTSSLLLVDTVSQQGTPSRDSLATTLVNRGIVSGKNVKAFENTPSISKAELKEAFMSCLSKADKEGIFVFVYAGPAVKVGAECSLQLTDFAADNPVTHATPTTLLEWLSEASNAQPLGHALFVLDCPFAAEMSSGLTDCQKTALPLDTQLYAVGAEPLVGGPSSLASSLGAPSIFHFFLNWFIASTEFMPGNLPLNKILLKATSCTTALSSLIVPYDKHKHLLKPATTEPKVCFIQRFLVNTLGQDGEDQTDSFNGLDFLNQLFDRKKSSLNLHPKITTWLYGISDVRNDSNPLRVLAQECAGNESILATVIYLIMYSIASCQAALGGKSDSIAEPNIFIIAFISTMATVQIVFREVHLDMVDVCKRSWDYYHLVVVQNNFKDDKLKKLYHAIRP